MGTMRVSQVAGAKNLVWFYFVQQIHCNSYIFFTNWFLFNTACFIKRKIEERNILFFYPDIAAGCSCLTSSNKTFYCPDLLGINLVRFFTGYKSPYICEYFLRFPGVNTGYFFKSHSKVK